MTSLHAVAFCGSVLDTAPKGKKGLRKDGPICRVGRNDDRKIRVRCSHGALQIADRYRADLNIGS